LQIAKCNCLLFIIIIPFFYTLILTSDLTFNWFSYFSHSFIRLFLHSLVVVVVVVVVAAAAAVIKEH
jgi:uncharacterized membrane protein YesL